MWRVVVLVWLVGAVGSGVLLHLGGVARADVFYPPFLLNWLIFWPLLTIEMLGANACIHGCSSSVPAGMADLITWLLPYQVLDTLTFPIVCAVIAWLIIRGRRRKPGRMLR